MKKIVSALESSRGFLATVVTICLILFAAANVRAQFYGVAHAKDAQSYLTNSVPNDAGPDSLILVSGGGLAFDTISTPFPIQVSIYQYNWVNGQGGLVKIPIVSTVHETMIVTAVVADTLVVGTRAYNSTIRRAWPKTSLVEAGTPVSLAYIKNLQDSVTARGAQTDSLNGSTKLSKLAADTATTLQTVVNTPLQFTIATAGTYEFDAFLQVGNSGTNGTKIAITVPTSATLYAQAIGNVGGITAYTTDIISASATLGANFNTTAISTDVIWVHGTVTSGGTGGQVMVGFAATTSGTATIKAKSFVRSRRIP